MSRVSLDRVSWMGGSRFTPDLESDRIRGIEGSGPIWGFQLREVNTRFLAIPFVLAALGGSEGFRNISADVWLQGIVKAGSCWTPIGIER